MITAIRSVGQFVGWEFFLAGIALCILISVIVFLSFSTNRGKTAIVTFLLIQLIVLEACDTIWSFYFFPNGEYVNRGAAWSLSVFILTLPSFSTISLAVCTWFNRRKKKQQIHR